jgi:hypothetical protein
MEFKIITFWAVLTTALYVVTKISYIISGSTFNWKYYKQETWVGAAYLCVLNLGGLALGAYLLVKIGIWWFD